MQDPIQGQPIVQAPAVPDGQGQPVPEPAGASQQGVPEPAPTGGQPDDSARYFQSQYNQKLAENLALQRQIQQMQEQMQQPSHQAPPDPQSDWAGWLDYKLKEQEANITRQYREQLAGLITAAEEASWQQKHPEADLSTVKNFMSVRGIRNIEDAYTLLTLNNRVQSVATNTAQNALRQFQQPQNQAVPLRGTVPGAPTQTALRYEDLAIQFQQSNGRVYDQWPKELQEAFDKETAYRDMARRTRQ